MSTFGEGWATGSSYPCAYDDRMLSLEIRLSQGYEDVHGPRPALKLVLRPSTICPIISKISSIMTRLCRSVSCHEMGQAAGTEVPKSRFLAPSPQDIVHAVCNAYRITADDLLASRRGTPNEPRSVAIQLFRSLRNDTLACIGKTFEIRTSSTVSSILLRLQSRLKEEKALRTRVDSLKKRILASQEQT